MRLGSLLVFSLSITCAVWADDAPPTAPEVPRTLEQSVAQRERARATRAAAEERYEGLADHPFPTCFSCGTARDPADALCLRPGPLDDGTGRYATTWVPREASVPLVWAALDCPGAFAIDAEPILLGRMSARSLARPSADAPIVVIAWRKGQDRRKHFAGSALFTEAGDMLAFSEQTWIQIDAHAPPKEL